MAVVKTQISKILFPVLKREYKRMYILYAMALRGDDVKGYPGWPNDDEE